MGNMFQVEKAIIGNVFKEAKAVEYIQPKDRILEIRRLQD